MAIQFQCVSCRQPIEVDDDLASKIIACPYCRKTMTAPAESQLGDLAAIPVGRTREPVGSRLDEVASDSAPSISAAQPPYHPGNASQPVYLLMVPQRSGLAIAAAFLCGLAFIGVVYSGMISYHYRTELIDCAELLNDGDPFAGIRKCQAEYGSAMPTILFTFIITKFIVALFALSAVILGLIAQAAESRRQKMLASLPAAALPREWPKDATGQPAPASPFAPPRGYRWAGLSVLVGSLMMMANCLLL